jgi:hypothetical protein
LVGRRRTLGEEALPNVMKKGYRSSLSGATRSCPASWIGNNDRNPPHRLRHRNVLIRWDRERPYRELIPDERSARAS